ncbi:T-lymphocyte surface antigen Ly-9-like [Chaetodon auriga]|uniref:T-lymphocyte surface antigen Ly-9-like n=1 Tax=Chaetodon auriga TaxID=39042 RepID=UPI004032976E
MLLHILSCWIIAGITAEDPPTKHYRVKGSSLCLQVVKSPPHQDVQWSFNNKVIVFDKSINPLFKDKVDYSPGNHSLCIRNLTETDVGIYKAFVTDPEFVLSRETHSLIIQEPLPTPLIWTSERYSNRSAGICNITVNCSIQGWLLRSVCDEDSCTPSQRSFSEVNITISAVSASIVCSANNHVSSSNASESLEAICFNKSNSEEELPLKGPIVVVLRVIVCVFVCACIACVTWRHFCSRK